MPQLENRRREMFARLIALGKRPKDAHKLAGFHSSTSVQVARFMMLPEIGKRVEELKHRACVEGGVGVIDLVHMSLRAYELAMSTEDVKAAVLAIKELGILTGARIEKSERKVQTEDLSAVTDDELAEFIRQGGGTIPFAAKGAKLIN